TEGKLELRKRPVELRSLVQAAVETSQPLIDSGRHKLTVILPDRPIHLDADPVRMAQVISNLLNNAAKYIPEGGDIRLESRREEGEVVLTVADNGMGLAPELMPRLFEMFAQGPSGLEQSQGGLGIGLSLVKGLVNLHGGSVTAESAGPGQGSRFSVRLQVMDEAVLPFGASAGLGTATRAHPSGLRILAADDSRDVADSLAQLLRSEGHEVRVAYGGAEAIEIAGDMRPDVIVLDIGMPEVNGLEACRRIRGRFPDLPAVMVAMTGWGQAEDRAKSQAAGFQHHLVKPVDVGVLLGLLNEVQAHRLRVMAEKLPG